jgi:hypothetical protein
MEKKRNYAEDVTVLTGSIVVITGVALLSHAAAFIVAGAFILTPAAIKTFVSVVRGIRINR